MSPLKKKSLKRSPISAFSEDLPQFSMYLNKYIVFFLTAVYNKDVVGNIVNNL